MKLTCPRRASLFALACLALCASPSASALCGVPTLPIAARPTMPTAYAWSAALGNAAGTMLRAQQQPPPTITAAEITQWTGVNFSRHHIIPQTYLQALVQLSGSAALSSCDAVKADRLVIASALQAIKHPAAGAPLLTAVAWAPVNLFEGPVSFLRGDDPGSMPEASRPKSFDQPRWAALKAVVAGMDQLGAMSQDGTAFVVTDKKLLTPGGSYHAIAVALQALAKLAQPAQAAAYANADWVDNNRQAINLKDIVGYIDSRIVITTPLQNKEHAYSLKQ